MEFLDSKAFYFKQKQLDSIPCPQRDIFIALVEFLPLCFSRLINQCGCYGTRIRDEDELIPRQTK